MPSTRSPIDIQHAAEDAAAHFPALLLEAERIAHSVAVGLHGRRRAGPGETFWQHRPYGFGDPVSSIDWRQSARAADRLYVRQNEWEAAAAAYFWRDGSQSLNFAYNRHTPTKRERADILITALTILLSQAGERIGLISDRTHRRPFQGRTAPERMLEALEIGRFADHSDIPTTNSLPAGTRTVFVSDFFAPLETVERSVAAFANSGAKGILLQICDPSEEDFPFEGRVEFRDLESDARLTFGDTTALQSSYKEKFNLHREGLVSIARKYGWTFTAHRTDYPPQTVLLSMFTALADLRGWNS
ncbi:DUF58 domain-containing protein [Hyphococcus formosus]|uniref:DUF58 domain-containing protein n=1 Tax=Hyphococcus formosus TaxID=3143534 RepID=UPI00398A58E6